MLCDAACGDCIQSASKCTSCDGASSLDENVCEIDISCSNGALDSAKEECDDSNAIDGDGCSIRCTVEEGYKCTRIDSSSGNPDACVPLCGDGALDTVGEYLEGCDDGNSDSSDGCSSTCTIEEAFTCSREGNTQDTPDSCVHRCGNGALDP